MSTSKDHIKLLLKSETRLDGRKPLEIRKPLKVECGVIKTAEGSAKVTLGETQVLVGVKLELGEPYPDIPDQGTMIVGAELLPLSNPEFEAGPPGIHAVELARVVDRGIRESKAIDFKKLCIKKGELVWTLLVDIVPLNDAGNLQDASAIATLAALKDTVFLKLEGNKVIFEEKTDKKLEIKGDPIAVTVIKIGEQFIVDPLIEEEKAVESRLTVTSLKDGTLCAMQKGEEGALTKEEILKMIDIGVEKAKELRGAL
jgi:exosome complex component RRP42